MIKNYDHIDLNLIPADQPEGFFQHLEIPYEKTQEEVWANLDNKLAEKPDTKLITFSRHRVSFSIAATVLLLAGVFSLLRFYSTTISCPAGQHLSYTLPDESTIVLNAESKLAFHPFWWRFSRKLDFEGEGYFEVEKGKKFAVLSAYGSTEVLGTRFNIYSRGKEYKVTCFSGKVKVTSFSSEEAVLTPDYEANINTYGNIEMRKNQNPDASNAWINNMFNFTARPLVRVIKEIERQYNVKILLDARTDYSYTGYFSKDKPVEEVLTLVCKPFGLTFTRISEKEYEIFQN